MTPAPSSVGTSLDERSSQTIPLISVIVATFNRAAWLREALATLVCQRTDGKFEFEVIVVDNASTDETREVVEGIESDVPVRYLHQSLPGDAPTRNFGVSEAGGSWLAFFDDDQFAPPDWLLQLYSATLETGALVVGGAVHLDLTDEQLRQLGRHCRCALRELKPYQRLHPVSGRMDMGCGNAIVAREVFDRIGAFDTSFVTGGSDTNFFIRARAAGFMPWYTPTAFIRHRVQASRLSQEYFRWDSLRSAENRATHDFNRSNRFGVLAIGMARVGLTLIVHVPLLVLGGLRRDSAEVLDRKTRLWRTEGYMRRALSCLAPRLFRQEKFFKSIEFQSGRKFG